MSRFLPLFSCLLTTLFSMVSIIATGQELYYNQRPEFLKGNSVWAFGKHAGLDFNSGTAVAITTAMEVTPEGCATVSDRNTGELLFYTEGGNVWNANGTIMPYGDSLLGNRCIREIINSNDTIYDDSRRTTSQGALIVPVIDDTNKYYLFSLVGTTCDGLLPQATLYYSVVDMTLDSNRGDIVPGKKNIVLSVELFSEAMIAVPGNCNDIWLLLHLDSYHSYYAYHITAEGIDTVPVISNPNYAGSIPLDDGPTLMTISPDRSMLAIGGLFDDGFFLGSFDPATGQVSDIMVQEHSAPYSASFSPDNSKLYISDNFMNLTQYDLSIYDSAAIANSAQSIYSLPINRYRRGMLKLYNDTIYQVVNTTGFAHPLAADATLGFISKPNLAGAACDFQEGTVQALPPSLFMAYACVMSSEVVYPISDSLFSLSLDTSVCAQLALNAAAGSDYIWEDGSTIPGRTITQSGTYWVQYKDACANTVTDTFVISVTQLDPVIRVDGFALSTTLSFSSYQWLLNGVAISGAEDSIYTVLENGDYQVVVSDESGCTDTSAIYPVNNVGISDGRPLTDAIRVYPNPVDEYVYIDAPIAVQVEVYAMDGRCVIRAEYEERINVTKLPNGLYLLKIYDSSDRLVKIEKFVK